jgi:lipopolysaccharide biosynthesis protein
LLTAARYPYDLVRSFFGSKTLPRTEADEDAEPGPDASVPTATVVEHIPPNIRGEAADELAIRPIGEPDLFALRAMTPQGRIAVVVHLHDRELWPQLRDALENISEPFDLFVTVVEGISDQLTDGILASYPAARVIAFPDHTRDVFPFVTLINSGTLYRYQIVCKIDARPDVSQGESDRPWHDLIGDPQRVTHILSAFDADPDLGLVVSDQDLQQQVGHRVPDLDRISELCARIGMQQSEIIEQAMSAPQSYWVRPFLLRMVGSLKLAANDFDSGASAGDGTTDAVARLVGIFCRDSGMHFAATNTVGTESPTPLASPPQLHAIAFYLPQFHPISENDTWWGPGFTEWTNVTRARPQFRGHRQPRLPADLGFYDLRLPEAREAQADLAREYGLSAFCYYYYWFDGQKLLDRPLNEVLATGKPDFPFLLLWANEPWSRGWDGKARDILMPQNYRPGWATALAKDVAPFLRDPRYFLFQGAPVFLIYRPGHIPHRIEAFREFRVALAELGIPRVHFGGTWPAFGRDEPLPPDPASLGFDSYVEFEPRLLRKFSGQIRELFGQHPSFDGTVYDYNHGVDVALTALSEPVLGTRHRGVTMGWDNTARRIHAGRAFHGATPSNFRRWLRGIVEHELKTEGPPERLIFINAWNEWAEGTYLEPDQDFGRGWLEAAASAIGRVPGAKRKEP